MTEIQQTLEARPRDLGNFTVGRVLPQVGRKMVGPFTFLDHMGPASIDEMVVRPHPHINLATVTYLFRGEILHRDSLGSKQAITPGAINWMSAGRGIAHSERIARDGAKHALEGLQLWIALPQAEEETAPFFRHHPAASLPELVEPGATIRVLCGNAYGATSPVETVSPAIYVDYVLTAGAKLELPADYRERAIYVVDGAVTIGGQRVEARHMAVLSPGATPELAADAAARVVLIGGEPLDGPRYIWWNFVSSSPDRIHEAAARWRGGSWEKVFDDEVEFTPAPADGPKFAEPHESHG
ncbi:MAG: pirin family protein [Kofleriaceae bacterium]